MNPFETTDDPRRRLLIRALVGGLFAGPWTGVEAQVIGGRPTKLPPGQSIYRVDGKVLVNGQVASVETRIGASDVIETAASSSVVFVVGDNAMLVRAESRIALKSASPAAPLSGFEVQKGRILTVFGPRERRQITTATASIGIRGTGFYVEAEADRTYFCTCYGVTEVAARKDAASTTTVTSKHHDRPLYIVADAAAGNNIRNAPFINHTDPELMLIETLVGRTTPFVFPGRQYDSPRSNSTYRN